jgi:hypothetical protein
MVNLRLSNTSVPEGEHGHTSDRAHYHTVRLGIVIIFTLLFIVFCSGCASVRATPYNECGVKYMGADKVVCENKAIQREDRRFKREQERLIKEACTRPYWWDARVDKCRTMNQWIQ